LIASAALAGVGCSDEDRPPAIGDYIGEGAGGGAAGSASAGTAGSGPSGSAGSADDAGAAGSSGAAGSAGAAGSGGTASSDTCRGDTRDSGLDVFAQATLEQLRGYRVVDGDLYIGGNINVTATDVSSLAALSCLETVTGHFSIFDSPDLRDLSGLERLTQVNRLSITNNVGLETLEQLNNLVVEDSLTVRNNPSLSVLGDGIVGASELAIGNNATLPQCLADALAERLGSACTCAMNDEDATCP
jgi:hypothetical protein